MVELQSGYHQRSSLDKEVVENLHIWAAMTIKRFCIFVGHQINNQNGYLSINWHID